MVFEILERHGGRALGRPEPCAGDELAEVGVAFVVFHEQRQARAA